MEIKKNIFVLFILILSSVAVNARVVKSVTVHGSSGIVDVNNILPARGIDYSQEMLRKISADITLLYHRQGYTAFFIERVIFEKNGRIEFFFVESRVSRIRVTGIDENERRSVSRSLYTEGEIFNEVKLRKNIKKCKKIHSLRRVHISFERTNLDNLVIIADVEKSRMRISLGVKGDPVYGATPHGTIFNNFGKFFLNVSMLYAPGIDDRARGEVTARLGYPFSMNRNGIIAGASARRRADVSDRDGIYLYDSQGFSGELGLYSEREPFFFNFFGGADYDTLDDYEDAESVSSFYGGIRLSYKDMPLRIEAADAISFSGEIKSGRSSIKGEAFLRVKLDFSTSVRLMSRLSSTIRLYSFFTTEDDIFFREYVFDAMLPGRKDDFLRSSMRGTASAGFPVELYKNVLYMGPAFYGGIYDSGEEYCSALSSGGRVSVNTGSIIFDISYAFDVSETWSDGIVMFAAKGSF